MTRLILLLLLLPALVRAQIDTWDMTLTEVYVQYNKDNYQRHEMIRDNQLATTATMKLVREKKQAFTQLVDQLNQRLTSAFIVLADLTILYDVYQQLDHMTELQGRILTLAYKYPYTVPVAAWSQRTVVRQAQDLTAFVSLIVLSYGDISKMKTSSRQIIFRNVTDQLRLMTAQLESTLALLKRNDIKEILRQTGIPLIDFYQQDRRSIQAVLSQFK